MTVQETTAELLERERLDVDDARWVLGEATRRLVPTDELDGWWDGYEKVAMAYAASQPVCARSLLEMRQSLEYIRSEDEPAEYLIAASKMVLSALVVFTTNPTGGLLTERDIMHDDIDPLVSKAVELLDTVAEELDSLDETYGTARFVVEFDADHPVRIKERNQQNRMRYLIENAVRPSA